METSTWTFDAVRALGFASAGLILSTAGHPASAQDAARCLRSYVYTAGSGCASAAAGTGLQPGAVTGGGLPRVYEPSIRPASDTAGQTARAVGTEADGAAGSETENSGPGLAVAGDRETGIGLAPGSPSLVGPGFTQAGIDRNGQTRFGIRRNGQSREGIDRSGLTRNGVDPSGQTEAGIDQSGRDHGGRDANLPRGSEYNLNLRRR